MENHPNPEHEHSDGVGAADASTSAQAHSQPQPEKGAFAAFRDAIYKGAEDARTAAEQALPKVKSAAAGAAYWTAYGVSFAAVFHWTCAKGLAPELLKSGFRDGVKGGTEAAEKWIEKLKQRKEKTSDTVPDQAGTSTDTIQPGMA